MNFLEQDQKCQMTIEALERGVSVRIFGLMAKAAR
jgi:hypothetical protein